MIDCVTNSCCSCELRHRKLAKNNSLANTHKTQPRLDSLETTALHTPTPGDSNNPPATTTTAAKHLRESFPTLPPLSASSTPLCQISTTTVIYYSPSNEGSHRRQPTSVQMSADERKIAERKIAERMLMSELKELQKENWVHAEVC